MPPIPNTPTSTGYQPLPNTTKVGANYTLQQGDGTIIALAALTVTLTAYTPQTVAIDADGGDVLVTGPIQGGNVIVPHGKVQFFTYSDASAEWSTSSSAATETPV